MSVHNLRYSLFLFCSLFASGLAAQAKQIELGAGYSSDDAFRPGQYSGYPSAGSFAIGGFNLYGPAEGSRHWQIEGADLGLETSKLKASYGNWGRYLLEFTFSQLPQSEISNVYSPFTGYGSANQSLPAGWTGASSTTGFTFLNSALNEFDIDKKRQRFTGEFNWQLASEWALNAEYRHETKEGNDTFGAIFGSTGGNPRGALLARPIEFTTSEISLRLDHADAKTQYGIGYSLIFFENQASTLRWDNPFNNSQWLAAANFSNAATGQLALEPDNESAQINLYAGHNFSAGTRISASLSKALLVQDEDYLPYSSVIAAPIALPGSDLNGEVETLTANLNFSSRLNQRSTLRLRYSFRDRDNHTRQALFLRVAGDVANQATLLSDGARLNRIYDQAIDKFSVDLDYRFTGKTRASAGYAVEENDRSMVDVEATTEQTGFLKLDLKPFSMSSAWVKLSHAERETAGLDTTRPLFAGHNPDYVATLVGAELFQNDPYLRRFHISARDRDELSGSLNLYPTASVGINLLGRVRNDDYPNTLVGLQESQTQMLAVDLAYTPGLDWSAGLFYNFENYHNQQAGYSRSGGANPTPASPMSARDAGRNWRMQSEDFVHTLGGSLGWAPIGGRLALSLDATYTDATTESDPYSSGLAWLPYPDIT
ncbi:MAG: MtrB/PioB family decaheme-associated outer membrane protein, partial [Pseudohongiellaceae bacterium]